MISRTRSSSSFVPRVELIGPWIRTGLFIADLDVLIAAGSMKGQESAAKKLKALTRKHIKQGFVPGIHWPALKPSYSKAKARDGYDGDRILYRTGLYHKSITTWSKGTKWYVGVKRGISASGGGKNSRRTVGWIDHILERGSAAQGIPARPLWVPTFKIFGGNKKIKSIIVWHIASLIYMKHGVRAKIY